MKFLSVIAASLAAYAAAQDKSWGGDKSFRGSKDSTSRWGKKPTSSKWGKKPSGSGKGPTKGSWHDFFNRYNSHECTTKYVPKDLLARYKSEFEALDTNHDGSISPAEFSGTGAKIASAFSSLKDKFKGKGKGGSHGGDGQHHYGHHMEGSGSGSSHHFGGRGGSSHSGGFGGGFGGHNRQLADKKWGGYDKSGSKGKYSKGGYSKGGSKKTGSSKSSWWKYLESHGFVKKTTPMTAASKAAKEAKMAAGVFSKFDKNHSKSISVCEFENAMYRTESLEKRLGMKTDDNIVVVHGR